MKPQPQSAQARKALEAALRKGFAAWFKLQRDRTGITQEGWAFGIGKVKSQKTLWNWENEETRPRTSEDFALWASWIANQQGVPFDAAKVWSEIYDQARASLKGPNSTAHSRASGKPHPLENRFPVSRLRHNAQKLIGRDDDLARLDAAWNDPQKNVVIVRAFGGMGKTSLVATWIENLRREKWRGAERFFSWPFTRQGTSDPSADPFIEEALRAFGDPDPKLGSAWNRGERLARLVGKSRCLLVLDGLEPLQDAPGPTGGKLKDVGIEALLKGLVAENAGLCVVTTREKVDEIKQHYTCRAEDFVLSPLTDLYGASLLHYAGATRAGAKEIAEDDEELQAASREVRGHGLTLQLLGHYLRLAEEGDIRRRDTVRLADADHQYQSADTRPYGHAFKAMEAYEKWFESEGKIGRRQLAVLRLLGLFDRPASKVCLDALRTEPVIAGLTEPLLRLSPQDWKVTLSRLKDIDLVAERGDGSLDAHPLLREYFGSRVRKKQPKAWRSAHQRLYEHLCETTKEGDQPSFPALQPLYQAVAHGCKAGLQRKACEVYWARILKKDDAHSSYKLGAYGADLGAIACFFETRWNEVSPVLEKTDQAWMLSEAGLTLRALGRLKENEALEPMRASLEKYLQLQDWEEAARVANNLSQLKLTMGDVAGAVEDGEMSVTYADRSDSERWKVGARTAYADALHHAGDRAKAGAYFREAVRLQAERKTGYLYSVQSFRYCEMLFAEAERVAWQLMLRSARLRLTASHRRAFLESCRAVSRRAEQALKWDKAQDRLGDIALGHLSQERAALYEAVLKNGNGVPSLNQDAASRLDQTVDHLRNARSQRHIPAGLLTRAWQRSLNDARTGPQSAQSDLDDAREIAERAPMPLFLADIHLYRARLFHGVNPYPWKDPHDDLAGARRLIKKHGYLRRMEELEDAEAAAAHWPQRGSKAKTKTGQS